jgi:hypothetical protein
MPQFNSNAELPNGLVFYTGGCIVQTWTHRATLSKVNILCFVHQPRTPKVTIKKIPQAFFAPTCL